MKLSENEKKILKELLADGSISNAQIAKKVGLTPAAVGKIRKKLEKNKIISGYSVNIDFGKIGITTFAIILLKFVNRSWEDPNELKMFERFISQPNIINIYRIPEGETTHVVIFGFRNLNELDRYFRVLQSQHSDIFEIKKIFAFSGESILKDDSRFLFEKIIDEWGLERMPEPISLLSSRRKKKEEEEVNV